MQKNAPCRTFCHRRILCLKKGITTFHVVCTMTAGRLFFICWRFIDFPDNIFVFQLLLVMVINELLRKVHCNGQPWWCMNQVHSFMCQLNAFLRRRWVQLLYTDYALMQALTALRCYTNVGSHEKSIQRTTNPFVCPCERHKIVIDWQFCAFCIYCLGRLHIAVRRGRWLRRRH